MPKAEKQIDALSELVALAGACDRHAVDLAQAVNKLYSDVLSLRAANGHKGPSGSLLYIALQRCASRYFTGTPIKLTRGPHPSHKSFKSQVEGWLPSLSSPPVLQPISPQPPAEAA